MEWAILLDLILMIVVVISTMIATMLLLREIKDLGSRILEQAES